MRGVLRSCILVLVSGACLLGSVVSAAPAAQATFPPGAVVALNGTPHLWIADGQGTLHWGGDTRALQGQVIDWANRISISLDTLKTLQLGDPWLSAGLLQDGTPIYLVKWESNEAVPRLLHIQCIRDVELFGINGTNYGKFVLDRARWEARFQIPVSTLQHGELPSTDPSALGCPIGTSTPPPTPARPVIKVDLGPLDSTLRANGLTASQINVDRTTTLVLGSDGATVVRTAPLAAAPSQTVGDVKGGANVPLGVLQADQDLALSGGTLRQDIYLVRVRSGRVVFINSHNQETPAGRSLDARQLSRTLPRPQTTLTARDVCFGWNQAQVCTDPSPGDSLRGAQRRNLEDTMNAARDALNSRGLLSADVNVSVTLAEAEGDAAVKQKRANMVAAPARNLADLTGNGPPADGTFVGIFAVDRTIDVPNYPSIPAGQYAVQSETGGTQAVLLGADGGAGITVPMKTLQVRGAPASGQPEQAWTIIANLCFGGGGGSNLCFLGEPD
jgi:hypothetical protein